MSGAVLFLHSQECEKWEDLSEVGLWGLFTGTTIVRYSQSGTDIEWEGKMNMWWWICDGDDEGNETRTWKDGIKDD